MAQLDECIEPEGADASDTPSFEIVMTAPNRPRRLAPLRRVLLLRRRGADVPSGARSSLVEGDDLRFVKISPEQFKAPHLVRYCAASRTLQLLQGANDYEGAWLEKRNVPV